MPESVVDTCPNLSEVAAALVEHHPGRGPWPAARREPAHHDLPETVDRLTGLTLPGTTGLLLRRAGAAGRRGQGSTRRDRCRSAAPD
ncbi:hypothetical protein ACFYRD_06000 [Streptomyces hirsutus]|uniref:hypothetical protein n=1 Tax=Streptomyces hirsutus TaxID=35620 RepID=UPI0033B6FB31